MSRGETRRDLLRPKWGRRTTEPKTGPNGEDAGYADSTRYAASAEPNLRSREEGKSRSATCHP